MIFSGRVTQGPRSTAVSATYNPFAARAGAPAGGGPRGGPPAGGAPPATPAAVRKVRRSGCMVSPSTGRMKTPDYGHGSAGCQVGVSAKIDGMVASDRFNAAEFFVDR